jgi:hypothetical protein
MMVIDREGVAGTVHFRKGSQLSGPHGLARLDDARPEGLGPGAPR